MQPRKLILFLFILYFTFPGQSFALPLDEKLQLQWVQYEKAQKLLLNRVGEENKTISRDEWEQTIKLPNNAIWTDEDIKELRKRHQEAIEASRLEALKRSDGLINLDRIRKGGKTNEFCKELPKGGMLHTHPWGTANKNTVATMLEIINPQLNLEKTRVLLSDGSAFQSEIDFLKPYKLFSEKVAPFRYHNLSKEDKELFLNLFFFKQVNIDFQRFLASFQLGSLLFFQNEAAWSNFDLLNDLEHDDLKKFTVRDSNDLLWRDFFARSKDEGLIYIETNKNVSPEKKMSIEQVEKVASQSLDFGILSTILVQFPRERSDIDQRKNIEILLNNPNKNIVGVNLVNDEEKYPLLEQGQGLYGLILKARFDKKTNLKTTVHAGELGDVRNIRDAMIFGVDRIGHGVRLWLDPIALEYARYYHTDGLPVEVSLTSNKLLQIVEKAGLEKHPWLDFLRLGLLVSFSTDDEGIFDTTISKECVLALSTTDVTYYELKQVVFNSILTSFASESSKAALLDRLTEQFMKFQVRWNNFKSTFSQPGNRHTEGIPRHSRL